jgi:hypothetical protein
MARIFMSHSSKDKPFIRKLSKDLRASGHEPWLDEWEIKVGECIVSKISDGISRADYAIIILTPDSVASGWVDREWSALYWSEIETGGIKVLPVLLRKCSIPSLLRSKRYADFTSSYEEGLSQLLYALSPGAAIDHTHRLTTNNKAASFRQLEPQKLTLQFEFISIGKILEAEVAANLQVNELKRLVMKEMSFSDQFLDGRVAPTSLYSVTREITLDDRLSLEENGVQNNEVLRLEFHSTAGG